MWKALKSSPGTERAKNQPNQLRNLVSLGCRSDSSWPIWDSRENGPPWTEPS